MMGGNTLDPFQVFNLYCDLNYCLTSVSKYIFWCFSVFGALFVAVGDFNKKRFIPCLAKEGDTYRQIIDKTDGIRFGCAGEHRIIKTEIGISERIAYKPGKSGFAALARSMNEDDRCVGESFFEAPGSKSRIKPICIHYCQSYLRHPADCKFYARLIASLLVG